MTSGRRAIVLGVLSPLARYDTDRLVGLSSDRRQTSLRVLGELESAVGGDLSVLDRAAVGRHLQGRAHRGRSPGTVRKERAVIVSWCEWAHQAGVIDGETLIAVRAIRVRGGAPRGVRPHPYRRTELRAFRAALDERWPLLSPDEAQRWLTRHAEGRSPYSRVRSHLMRCQLDAVIALALYQGLRRHEIRALTIDGAHHDNDQIVVWEPGGERPDDSRPLSLRVDRSVPYTAYARTAVARWVDCRYALGVPDMRTMWLNLHAERTSREPLKPERFDHLLAAHVAPGWTLKRLRDTCAVTWVRAGLPPERLRQMLGLARIEDVTPYMRSVDGQLDTDMGAVEDRFGKLIGPVIFD